MEAQPANSRLPRVLRRCAVALLTTLIGLLLWQSYDVG
jgi:hypothetical protein